jgi:hypothetical protein
MIPGYEVGIFASGGNTVFLLELSAIEQLSESVFILNCLN